MVDRLYEGLSLLLALDRVPVRLLDLLSYTPIIQDDGVKLNDQVQYQH